MKYKFKDYAPSTILRNHLNLGDKHFSVNSLYIERDKTPWIGVMGEYHFSRDKKENWYTELCKMKAGGVTLVSTYIFWIYHEEEEGKLDFTGDLDIRSFVLEAQKAGLDVVLRIGPWAHGECRNGGFPDWLMQKPYKLRNESSEFMAVVKGFFARISKEVEGLLLKDGGNIVAIQLENEICDAPDYLAELKLLAKEVGLDVPIYTVTGWNSAAGAEIPVDEVIPVFGGYIELPWENHKNKLPPSQHYFFSPNRNDSSIGKDLLPVDTSWTKWRLPYEKYPFATCELGGGIENTHHRRAMIDPMDIYALSLVKLGCGNNLIGYYMYHGGTNKLGKLSTFQESKATGYPNDYPILSYDFQAPLSEYGCVREHYRLLNMLHMFVNDFGHLLAPMEYVGALVSVLDVNDNTSLRYSMRTDGNGGFIFVNNYQRNYPMNDIHDVIFDTGSVVFPSIEVKNGASFILPFNLNMDGALLKYATAQLLCKAEGVHYFAAIRGITPEFMFEDGTCLTCEKGLLSHGNVKIIVLSPEQAKYARKLSGKMYVGEGCDLYECEGEIRSSELGSYSFIRYDGIDTEKVSVSKEFVPPILTVADCSEPFVPPYDEELNIGCTRERQWKKLTVDSDQGFVYLDIPCDAAQIYADGELVADLYYYGVKWEIPAALLYGRECYLVLSEMKDDFYREF